MEGERKRAVKILNRIMTVFFVEIIVLCLLASYVYVSNSHSQANIQSTATLVIFNVLFVSLLFQLKGSLNRKLGLLTAGNVLGLCWNIIFNYFDITGTLFFGSTFNNLYMVFFPFVSSLWMISFWSLSLTILHKDNAEKRRFTYDH